jgi:YD repeat-containing protein
VVAPVSLAAALVAFLHGGNLVVVNVATHAQRVVMRHAGSGPVAWSGDGRLVSSGGKIAGGPALPTPRIAWAPVGERAAYLTARGAAYVWGPRTGFRLVVPAGWGARGLAWSRDGRRLAIGRTVCRPPCAGTHHEVWTWNGHDLRRLVRLSNESGWPTPFAWDTRGRVLWWEWPDSSSIAADGVALHADARKIATMLMYPDWIATCGSRLALAVGVDRNSLHGKSIVLDGRDVSRDRTRSWVSPACRGPTLVAAASRDNPNGPWGSEHRSLWQLLPTRRRLTTPPHKWSDEWPTILGDGSILFVRTHITGYRHNGYWRARTLGTLELLRHGRVTPVADVSDRNGGLMYYGHYDWPQRIAVESP